MKNGYLTPKNIDLPKVRRTIESLKPDYEAYFHGTKPLDAKAVDTINQYRTALRELAGSDNPEVTTAERQQASAKAQQALRVAHFDNWKDDYARHSKNKLAPTYQTLGLKQPSPGFEKMTRKQATDEAQRVITAIHQHNKAAGKPDARFDASLDLPRGMTMLDPNVVKSNWVTD